ncbi:MAG: hypothetical protein GXY55_05925 [Phycisphaerae bacterium]|nr:hypothetical protein [Phycisphaerae bacterium]
MSPADQPTAKPPPGLPEKAEDLVVRMLKARLVRGGISTTRPEWYFQVERTDPQPQPAGWQVRVRTWRHWSDARVHLDADGGEVMHRCVDRLAEPPTDARLSQEEALRAAAGAMEIPRDARLSGFGHEPFADGGYQVARLEWEHYIKDVRVDGDYLWVQIHPITRRLVAYGLKWRKLK